MTWLVSSPKFVGGFCATFLLFFRSAMVGDKEVGGGDLPTIADDLVVTKYKMAAEIVNSE